jgi:alanine dehydrogenase
VYEGYQDRAKNSSKLIDEPRHRLIDTDTGMGIYNHFGISSSAGVGGALLHAHQVHSDTERQEFGNEGEAVYILYDSESSNLRAIIVGEMGGKEFPPKGMQAYGTALETAVGTDVLARENATSLGIFGSGRQAQNCLVALDCARDLDGVKVYSPAKDHRRSFRNVMSEIVDLNIQVVESPQEVIDGADMILCATSASSPVFDGDLLEPGQHVTTIVGADIELVEAGQAPELRREIDNKTIDNADLYVANSVAQGKQNKQGDLYLPVKESIISWEDIIPLPKIIGDQHPCRTNTNQITIYKQNSIQGVTQVALANKLLDKIESKDLGIEIKTQNPRKEKRF